MSTEDFVIADFGVRMPRLLYGTAWKKARTASLVTAALARGFRGIDTACQPKHYDEAGVGTGLTAALNAGLRREGIYLQTKFTPFPGQDPNRIPYDAQAPLAEQIAQSFHASLRNLQTDYLDGLVLHSPLADASVTLAAWRAFEAIYADGGAKQLGISNCYSLAEFDALYRAARVKPAVLQNRFYAATHYDRELRAYCRERRVFYQSFWTLTANAHLLEHPVLRELAAHYARTPAQILFRYLTLCDIVVLTGTTSTAHMDEDLAIFDFTLAPEECAKVTALL